MGDKFKAGPSGGIDAGEESLLPGVLMRVVYDDYKREVAARLEARAGRGLPVVSHEEAVRRAPASDFAKFANTWFDENRAVRVFYAGEGIGLEFADGRLLTLSTSEAEAAPGSMQASDAVEVTTGGVEARDRRSPRKDVRI